MRIYVQFPRLTTGSYLKYSQIRSFMMKNFIGLILCLPLVSFATDLRCSNVVNKVLKAYQGKNSKIVAWDLDNYSIISIYTGNEYDAKRLSDLAAVSDPAARFTQIILEKDCSTSALFSNY